MAFFFFLLGLLAALGALAVAFLRLPAKLEAKLRAMTAAKKPGVWNKRHPALRDLKLLPNTAAPDMAELKLKVKIIEATGLAPAEKNGSSDAYVRLSFGGQSRKTKFIPKSLHPHVRPIIALFVCAAVHGCALCRSIVKSRAVERTLRVPRVGPQREPPSQCL